MIDKNFQPEKIAPGDELEALRERYGFVEEYNPA